MRYQVVTPFAVKTKKAGVVNLTQGQVVELAKEKAVSFLSEGKIKDVKLLTLKSYDNCNVIEKVLRTFEGKIVGFTGILKELFEERSAIMEFDGGLTKKNAEAEAIKNILNYITYFGSM